MFIEVTESIFRNEWNNSNRSESFSYEGLKALYENLIECEYEGSQELDIIELDGIYSEYNNIEDYNKQTGNECYSIIDITEGIVITIPKTNRFIVGV